MRTTILILTCIFSLLVSCTRRDLPSVSQLPSIPGLPDPLVMFDGTSVMTREAWLKERRPELKRLFQHYMYGYLPSPPGSVKAETVRVNAALFKGKATKKEITIHFGPEGTPPIHLLLVTPNAANAPAPVFLGLNFCGNHTLLADPTVALPPGWIRNSCPGCEQNRATDAGRGARVGNWDIEASIEKGYAVATFYYGDIDPDFPDFNNGVHPHYWEAGQTSPGLHDWGAIAAWAWGLHRAVDYLATNQSIDPDRIAVMGHSRNGKAALLAAAFDERIALVIPHQAGCGGTAPSRGTVGETVKKINDSFPHWFNDTFPEFNEQVDRLPFDQHCLIALVAPRPVLLSNAVEDTWANPQGQFEMLQAAAPVYRLLDVEGLSAERMPGVGVLVDSRLGYYIRPGKHSTTPADWQVFREYVDKHFKR